MDLTSRLRQLLPQASSAVPAPKKSVDLDPLLGGTEVETPLGPCYLVTKQLPLAHRHGNWPLSEVYKSAYTHLARFAPGGGIASIWKEPCFSIQKPQAWLAAQEPTPS